jgi:hypothetical protein
MSALFFNDKLMSDLDHIFLLSNPDVKISRISKGFWMCPQHLANQFEYLTGCANLTEAVRQNLFLQLGGFFFKVFAVINKLIRPP